MKNLRAATSFIVLPAVIFVANSSLLAQQGGNANSTVSGGTVTGGAVRGGTVSGGNTTGSSGTGSSVQGGSVTGGTVTGGSVTGGTVTSGTVTPGTASATVDGRQVTARATGSVSISSHGPNANVTIGNHTVIVQKERLLVDGQERGKIPPGATKVSIEVANGQLSVNADGQSALSLRLDQQK